jgi:hypothetical protein
MSYSDPWVSIERKSGGGIGAVVDWKMWSIVTTSM